MSRPDTYRSLLALVLLAALPAGPQTTVSAPPQQVSAQVSAQVSTQAPAPTPPQPANDTSASPQSPTPAPTTVIPVTQATPEQIGDSLQGHQRYQAAIAAYAKEPNPSASLWNKMGIAYQMMFNLKDATRCYKESLKLNPRNAQVFNNLGTVYDSNKDYSGAEKMYRKALKLDPKSAVTLKNLGTNLLVQRKYAKGWQAYQEALAIEPNIFQDSSSPKIQNPSSVAERGAMNYYMARGCVRTGQPDCAIQYLRMALDEGFTNAKKLAADEDFASLRTNPAFKQLLADQKQQRNQ